MELGTALLWPRERSEEPAWVRGRRLALWGRRGQEMPPKGAQATGLGATGRLRPSHFSDAILAMPF